MMGKLYKLSNLFFVKSYIEMELEIADILDMDDSIETRGVITVIATEKCKLENWGESYEIPNINGLKRPLTIYEMEDIMNEDRDGFRKRRFV